MKIYVRYFLLLVFVIIKYSSFSQNFKVGDSCPDMIFRHVMNYKTATIKLSSLKGKAIIFDFWNPACAGCIHGFPALDSLQKRFQDSIQVFLVNAETEDSTKRFFSLHKRLKKPDVAFITQDSILHKTFPQEGYPYQVWISKDGIVKAITDAMNATQENIAALLSGKNFYVTTKETVFDYDETKPYIAEGNGRWLDKVKYCSYIMNPSLYKLGVMNGSGPFGAMDDTNHLKNRITIKGFDIPYLFAYAFGENKYDFYHTNCIVLQVKDSSRFIKPPDKNLWDAWETQNLYTYDLMVPENRISERYKFMQQDLERYFDASGIVEKRKIKCWVLVRASNIDKLKSSGGKFNIRHIKTPDGDSVIYKNVPFENFTWMLKTWFSGNRTSEPFIDSTGYSGNIDMSYTNIDFNGDGNHSINFQGLRKILSKYDLDLKEEEYLTEVLVIREDVK